MKVKNTVRDYSTLALGSAIVGGIGGMAGAPGAPVVAGAMSGMNIMAGGLTARTGIGLMKDLGKMPRKKGML